MCTNFSLGKVFDQPIEAIEQQGRKQFEALEVLKPNIQKLTTKCDSGKYIN